MSDRQAEFGAVVTPDTEPARELRSGEQREADWLATLNFAVTALTRRVSRRVSRAAQRLADLAKITDE